MDKASSNLETEEKRLFLFEHGLDLKKGHQDGWLPKRTSWLSTLVIKERLLMLAGVVPCMSLPMTGAKVGVAGDRAWFA